MYVDDRELSGKKQNIDPMWKVLMKHIDLEEPTSFLDHVYLGCTQRERETSKDIVDNYNKMFESSEKYLAWGNLMRPSLHGRAKILWTITETYLNPGSLQKQKKSCLVQGDMTQTSLHCPMTWKVMQRNLWCGAASWPIKQLSNFSKSQLHALIDDHKLKEE